MDTVGTLIVGAGVTGLATSAALVAQGDQDFLVLERDAEIGGYCKTVVQDGFTWDYSGHFFHFRDPAIERWLRERMPGRRVVTVQKRSFIRWADGYVDFPFQKNIHQLPQDDFIDCLHGLWEASRAAGPAPSSFREMLIARYGRGIAERFLIPYNEKLYACDLELLDPEAMGRFFPKASFDDVMRQLKTPDNSSYNQTFTYPEGGAIQYVEAIARDVERARILLDEPVTGVDLERRVVTTPRRQLRYRRLVSSVPLPTFLQLCRLPHDEAAFSWNKVLVYNLGFDSKGHEQRHWVYYPQRELSYYRVGYYDNIFDAERMSLYVELGFPRAAQVRPELLLERVLADLRSAGVITTQRLIASHHVVMDPAYVHVTQRGLAETARTLEALRRVGVYSIGRYGAWTYCSIEDNLLQARELVRQLRAEALL